MVFFWRHKITIIRELEKILLRRTRKLNTRQEESISKTCYIVLINLKKSADKSVVM